MRAMLADVHQHASERVAYFTRCAENPQVISIAHHLAEGSEDAIDDPCKARAERLHAATEMVGVRCLDHEVSVVRLDRVFDDTEVGPYAKSGERALELCDKTAAAQ